MTWWNYLRVRGEYIEFLHVNAESAELPPRARRIPLDSLHRRHRIVNYLRVRGEYFGSVVAEMDLWELPPRARRIPDEAV